MADLFDFEDYRAYLKECFREIKERNPRYSYEAFSKKLGLNNRGFIYNIINEDSGDENEKKSRKNLPLTHCGIISAGLRHSPEEAEYFENIVAFEQAKNEKERTYFLKKARSIISEVKMGMLRKDQCEYYSKWYHSALFSLIEFYPVNDNYEQLGTLLTPPITADEAKNSLELLRRLELIVVGDDGFFHHRKEKKIRTGIDIPQQVKNQAHVAYADLAKNSIMNDPPESRHAVSLTLGISQETYKGILKEIAAFRNAIRYLIDNDKDPERVYQMEILMFPLSVGKKTGAAEGEK
jgi:uncharacterized protein (TIGR02147 family)